MQKKKSSLIIISCLLLSRSKVISQVEGLKFLNAIVFAVGATRLGFTSTNTIVMLRLTAIQYQCSIANELPFNKVILAIKNFVK